MPINKLLSYAVLSAYLCYVGVPVAMAQASRTSDETTPDDVDEVTVYGKKSLAALKFEYEVAETDFYDLYSELNDDWRYDVVCRKEAPTGSHIKRQVCWPRYALEAFSQEALAKLRRGNIDPGADALILDKRRELRNRIAKLAEQDPRLMQALVAYRDKYREYKSERKQRCAGNVLICGDGDLDNYPAIGDILLFSRLGP